jgi:hypothetical protein
MFINEDYSPAMLDYWMDAYDHVPESKKCFHPNVTKRPDADLSTRWLEELTPAEIYTIELILGTDLVRSGYELLSPPLGPQDCDQIRQLLEEHFWIS